MTVLLVNKSTLEEVVKGGSGPAEGLREVSLCHFFSWPGGVRGLAVPHRSTSQLEWCPLPDTEGQLLAASARLTRPGVWLGGVKSVLQADKEKRLNAVRASPQASRATQEQDKSL